MQQLSQARQVARTGRARSRMGWLERFALATVAGLFVAVGVAPVHADDVAPIGADREAILSSAMTALKVNAAELTDIVWTQQVGSVSATLAIDGVQREIEVEPRSFRSPQFRVVVVGDDGREQVWSAPAPQTVVGGIVGEEGSAVAGTLEDGRFTGMVWTNGGRYGVQPVDKVLRGVDSPAHVVYPVDAVEWPEGASCGVEHGLFDGDPLEPFVGEIAAGLRDGDQLCEIAIDTDYELFTDLGSNPDNVVAHVEGIIAGVSTQYRQDVGIVYGVTEIIVRSSSSDPYSGSDAETVLFQVRNHWRTQQTGVHRDIMHFFTGRTLNSPTLGLTFVGEICSSASSGYGYGLSWTTHTSNFSARVDLVAHELGHSWNAGHCNESGSNNQSSVCCGPYTMCSYLAPAYGKEFSPASISVINAYEASRSCLSPAILPIELPLTDSFAGSEFVPENWTLVNGAAISSGAVGEPSEPYSANLDADDELRSNELLVTPGGYAGATLSWYSESRSTESGEDLIVEYRTPAATWAELARDYGGATENSFEFFSVSLPADAIYDGVQIRFRSTANSTADDWYVDDVSLVGCLGASVTQTPVSSAVCPGSTAEFTVVVSDAVEAYQWYHDGMPLVDGGDVFGAASATLEIANADVADVGAYTVEVTNSCGPIMTPAANLTMAAPPAITTQLPSQLSVCADEAGILQVQASGTGPLSYEWRENGTPIPGAPSASSYVLSPPLTSAQFDGVEYTVRVSNACGEVVSQAAAVNVRLDYAQQPEDTCVNIGATLQLTATAVGASGWEWYRNGVRIAQRVGGETDILEVPGFAAEDAGEYYAIAYIFGASPCSVPSETAIVTVGPCGTSCATPGDLDVDGDYDLVDMQLFTRCFGTVGEGCDCADVDGDGNVDLVDWTILTNGLTGPVTQ